MSVPPDKVPDGLSSEEYARLVTLYTLMGCQNQAMEASLRAEMRKKESAPEEHRELTEKQYAAGQALAQNLLEAMFRGKDEGSDEPDPLELARAQLREMEVPEDEIDKCMEVFSRLINQSYEEPPKDVPEDLTAEEYYELGVRYKDIGWTEQARDALQYAIEKDPSGPAGQRALTYLRSKVPRHPVPMLAVQENIVGFNQMAAGDIELARETFRKLIMTYPDFEWPYGNLGTLLLQLGEVDNAKTLLKKALGINSYYLNGWLHLARVYAVTSDLDKALECLDRAEEIDHTESSIAQVRRLINVLKSQS